MEYAEVRQSVNESMKTRHNPGQSSSGASPSVSWPGGFGWRVLLALVGGLILRLWMLRSFPQMDVDTQIYGDLAKNMLLHRQFAITDGSGVIHSTLIRLPGYPLFLAACFQIFGVANYTAVICVQIAVELIACLLLADFVRRIANARAGMNTLWLAALCPFTAIYTVSPLTESLTISCICLALWSLERYLSFPERYGLQPVHKSGRIKAGFSRRGTVFERLQRLAGFSFSLKAWNTHWFFLFLFTFALSAAALLRPDGALIAFALWPALIFSRGSGVKLAPALRRAVLCGVLAVLPFGVWTGRNLSTFHVFEPLAPRYANDPGEDPHLGWQHWVKTWCFDFTCTYEVYWLVPGETLDIKSLPTWAFDNPAQRTETETIFKAYNDDQDISPELDQRFEALARERIAAHPLRNHVLLPWGRLLDMTLRPRVENLPIDLRWWQYDLHHVETRFSVAYGALNLILLGLGIAGLCLRPKFWGYMAAYIILRSLLLTTVEAPETRYTLEFFPIVFAMGGIALQRIFRKRLPRPIKRT